MSETICEATGLADMVYTTSGSEAVESAVKIALQYHYDRGDPARVKFIARKRSWHGNTLMATALSGFEDRQRAFAGALPVVGRVSAANAYRLPEGVTREGLVAHLAAELEAEILRLGPETVAAFIFEPVVGAAGGALPAPEGYGRAVAEVCRRHGVLVICDEVMCGSGRTGVWRASAEDGIDGRHHHGGEVAVGRLPAPGRGGLHQGDRRCDGGGPWRAADRAYLHRPHRLPCGGGGGAADHPGRGAAGAHPRQGAALAGRSARAAGASAAGRRRAGAGVFHRGGGRGGPRDEGPLRRGAWASTAASGPRGCGAG